MKRSLQTQRLVAVFFAGWLLFSFPLIALWDVPVRWFGVPLFPLALFLLWAGVIAAVAWLMERRAD